MDDLLEHRILELLREAGGVSLPLRRLHGHLVAEAGPTVGTYARFAEEIRSSRAFLVFEPEDPLGDGRDWPPGVRHAYETALAAAGVDRGPRLTLGVPVTTPADVTPPSDQPHTASDARPAAPHDASIAALRASLLDIWETAGPDSSLRAAVATAFADCAEMPRLIDGTG